jgi:YHS domain-containing protein
MENDRPASEPEETLAFPETVCHRTITGDRAYFPKAEYQGRTIYFCTDYCLNAFLSDPQRFFPAHSRRRVDPMKCEFNNEKG